MRHMKFGTSLAPPPADTPVEYSPETMPSRPYYYSSGLRRSVDVVAKGIGEGSPTMDFERLFAELKADCKYGPGSVH